MNRKIKSIISLLALIAIVLAVFSGCTKEYQTDDSDEWKEKFDVSSPSLEGAGTDEASANEEGWYLTLNEDFDGDTMPEPFVPSPHGLRNTEYWCDQMVSVKDGNAVVAARSFTEHDCDVCGVSEGDFTSGIETRKMVDGESVSTFEQAFGYYEARVLFPKATGMWSAFWLQSESMRNVGNKGEDGTEIDIYESSFFDNELFSSVGHALHYDGYKPLKHKCMATTRDTKINLYDGYHTFALKWTPEEYVFYVDGEVTWASDFGGVSKVPAFIRLTNEIRPNVTGPYAQKLGDFSEGDFYIDYVRVYQNVDYLDFIKTPDDFK